MKRKTIWVVTHDKRDEAPPPFQDNIIADYDIVGVYADKDEAYKEMKKAAIKRFRASYNASDNSLYTSDDTADILDNYEHRIVHHYQLNPQKIKEAPSEGSLK